MKRVVGIAAGMTLLVTGICAHNGAAAAAPAGGGAAAPGPDVARAPGLEWRPCPEPAADGQVVECAWLRVPLDHRHPEGQKIKIALNRIKGTATRGRDHLGPLLINPGGPGASGLELAKYIARTLPAGVIGRYDVIGFDPRGVGQSVPALSCVDPKRYFKAPRPDAVARNAAEEAVLVGRARAYAQACGSRWAWMLPYMSTEHVARDIDVIRAALGEQKISYFGYSYGTYLGAVYASLFPGHVRRLVLDSVVDPAGDWYSSNIAQDYAFERRHRDFLAWVARHNAVYRLGDDPEAVRVAYYAMRDRLRAHPAGKVIGPSELDDIFTVGGYNNTVWPELAAAFSAYVRQGDGGKLVEAQRKHAQNGPKEENGYAVYLSVQCRDSTWSRDWNSWRADMIRVNRAAPFMTWPNAWYNAPCAFWSVPGGTPPRITASPKLPPVLMLQSRRDAATPYEGALRMRRLFPNARMVVEPGGNHGVSLGGNACVDRHLAAYLRDGTLPASHVRPVAGPDASCPANAAPRPADKAAA